MQTATIVQTTPALHLARLSPARDEARVHVVCFPPTAGGFFTFLPWLKTPPSLHPLMPADIALWGVQLEWTAGWSYDGVVSALADALEAQRLSAPFVLCGASLGGLLAFGVARELRRRQAKPPLGLVVLAMCAPQAYQAPAGVDTWTLEDWRAELRKVGGTPDEVLHAPTRLGQLVAQLRGGLSIGRDFTYQDEPPFAFPLATFVGEHDQAFPPVTLEGWREQTTSAYTSFRSPEAGHLDVLQEPAIRGWVVLEVVTTIQRWLVVAA